MIGGQPSSHMFIVDTIACYLALFFCFLVGLLLFLCRKRERYRSHILFSHTKIFSDIPLRWRTRFLWAPRFLQIAALILFAIAFLDPHLIQKVPKPDPLPEQGKTSPNPDDYTATVEGITIYLVLDISGSMIEDVPFVSPETGQRLKIPKIDALKQVTKQFIQGSKPLGLEGRTNDLIGLVSFARVADILSPPTLYHDDILSLLDELTVVDSQDNDGTAIGYAVYKTASLIEATRRFCEQQGKDLTYNSTGTIVILVTDGLQRPHPHDHDHPLRSMSVFDAARHTKDYGIRLYIVNIEPAIDHHRFRHARDELMNAAHETGGKFFVTSTSQHLHDIYREIETIEKKALSVDLIIGDIQENPIPDDDLIFVRRSSFPYLISCGLVALFLSIVLSTTFLRRVP